MNSLAELYAAILFPAGDKEKARASPWGDAADAVAVFETILTMCILGLLGSSSWMDCQLYLTLSLLPETNVAGVCGGDEGTEVGLDIGVVGLSFL
jgi:hypothetical protein